MFTAYSETIIAIAIICVKAGVANPLPAGLFLPFVPFDNALEAF
jgi:hypothetical protein